MSSSASNYAVRMGRLSARILGHPVRPVPKDAVRVIKLYERKPLENNPLVTNYYPPHEYLSRLTLQLREYGLFRDEHKDFRDERVRKLILRGKPKPMFGSKAKKD